MDPTPIDNFNAASLTPTYQILLFGCRNPRGAQQTDDLADVIWHWIGRMAGHGIILDWPGGVEIITPLNDEQRAEADVLGVVVAKSHDAARPYRRAPALLGDTLPNGADDTALAALCLPLTADIQRAMMLWEIARLAARAIGLDLPAGRLYLVKGWLDEDEIAAIKAGTVHRHSQDESRRTHIPTGGGH